MTTFARLVAGCLLAACVAGCAGEVVAQEDPQGSATTTVIDVGQDSGAVAPPAVPCVAPTASSTACVVPSWPGDAGMATVPMTCSPGAACTFQPLGDAGPLLSGICR